MTVSIAAVGCSASSNPPEAADAATPASPPGDLYAPPSPLPAAAPGTLIWAEPVEGIDLHPPATIWRILYHSRDAADEDTAVSGFAVVPKAAPPDGPRPVFAWAHGTVGLGDQCAPSHEVRDNLPPYGGQQAERGAVLVATDYDGLGTPGVPTNGNGVAEARAVLDSVRAAGSLPGVGTVGDVVVAGHSQGGGAALFTGEIAPDYAPDLHLAGIVALAPGVELPPLSDALAASPYRGVDVIGAAALRSAQPDLDLTTVLSAAAIADLPRVESECVDDTVARYGSGDLSGAIISSPSADPEVRSLLERGSAGSRRIDVPVFIAVGSADEQVPPDLSERVQGKYCALGANSTRTVYDGADHVGVIDAASDDALAFIAARYDGAAAANGC